MAGASWAMVALMFPVCPCRTEQPMRHANAGSGDPNTPTHHETLSLNARLSAIS